MKRLFLTSSIGTSGVGASIRAALGHPRKLKTVFITTPIEVEDMSDDEWYQDDRKALTDNGFEIRDYTLTGKTQSDIENDLGGYDCLYISGGNEFWLKHQANKCQFREFVNRFVESGKIYIGTSAGSIIMAPDMSPALQITDPANCPEPITDLSGWGIVDFIPFPHWGSKEFKDVYLGGRTEKLFDHNGKIILLNNYEYIDVQGEWYRIVDVRKEK